MKLVSSRDINEVEDSLYQIEFKVTQDLEGGGDFEDYISRIEGTVFFSIGNEKPVEVGYITAYLVQAEQAQDDGWNLFELFDAHSGTLCEVYETFFDPETSELDEDFLEESVENSPNLLIIEEMAIQPTHRKKRLGQCVISRLYKLFGSDVSGIVTHLSPLQFVYDDEEARSEEHIAPMELDKLSDNIKKSSAKLRAYLGELGFFAWPGNENFVYFGSLHFMPSPDKILAMKGPIPLSNAEDDPHLV